MSALEGADTLAGNLVVMVRHLDAGPAVAFKIRGYKRGDRGVTDTVGNRGDKQDAAGHQSTTTTGRYDHDLPVVKPPRRR